MSTNDWLLEVARNARMHGAERLPVHLDDGLEDAWHTVCLVCSLDPRALAEVTAKHYGLNTAPAVPPTMAALRVARAIRQKIRRAAAATNGG